MICSQPLPLFKKETISIPVYSCTGQILCGTNFDHATCKSPRFGIKDCPRDLRVGSPVSRPFPPALPGPKLEAPTQPPPLPVFRKPHTPFSPLRPPAVTAGVPFSGAGSVFCLESSKRVKKPGLHPLTVVRFAGKKIHQVVVRRHLRPPAET